MTLFNNQQFNRNLFFCKNSKFELKKFNYTQKRFTGSKKIAETVVKATTIKENSPISNIPENDRSIEELQQQLNEIKIPVSEVLTTFEQSVDSLSDKLPSQTYVRHPIEVIGAARPTDTVADATYHEKTHEGIIVKNTATGEYYETHILTSCKDYVNLGKPNYNNEEKDQYIATLVSPRKIEDSALDYYVANMAATTWVEEHNEGTVKAYVEISAQGSLENTIPTVRKAQDDSSFFNEAGQKSSEEVDSSDYKFFDINDVD